MLASFIQLLSDSYHNAVSRQRLVDRPICKSIFLVTKFSLLSIFTFAFLLKEQIYEKFQFSSKGTVSPNFVNSPVLLGFLLCRIKSDANLICVTPGITQH